MDIAQLTAALQALVRETPGVDVRYVFDDENGLVKRPAGSAPLPVSLRQVADEKQAICRLLRAGNAVCTGKRSAVALPAVAHAGR
ncbi:hypothetical protein M8494_35850 [Serratia ureilytica]